MTLVKPLMHSDGLGFRKYCVCVFCTTVVVILGVHRVLAVDLFLLMINPSCLLCFVRFFYLPLKL